MIKDIIIHVIRWIGEALSSVIAMFFSPWAADTGRAGRKKRPPSLV
jgi:hypothetical protein